MLTITKTEFEERVLKSEKPVLVDFWAPWCGYCRKLTPAFDQLEGEYAGKLLTGKINIDEEPDLAERFQVMTIPTLLLFKDGKASEPLVNPATGKQIAEWLKQQDID